MNTLKQKFNVFITKNSELFGSVLFGLGLVIFLGVGMYLERPSQEQKDYENLNLVAYNEQLVHLVGSENYEIHTSLEKRRAMVALNNCYPKGSPFSSDFMIGFELKDRYYQGWRAIEISYKDVHDRISEKKYKVYDEPFQFDDSGTNSIVHANGWTTERYNLVAIK